jgi:hypothetical protein
MPGDTTCVQADGRRPVVQCRRLGAHPGETGITIGDLVDAAMRFNADHENCLNMVRNLSESGFEPGQPGHRYPSFHGQITLPTGHWLPVKEKTESENAEREDAQRVKAHEEAGGADIWYAYRKARRDAAANGEYPPR